MKSSRWLLGGVALVLGCSSTNPTGQPLSPSRPDDSWAVALGSGGRSGCCYGLALDETGHAYVTSTFTDDLTIGTHTLVGRGSSDLYLAKFDAQGHCLWAEAAGSVGNDQAVELAVTPDGVCYVASQLGGTAFFGGKLLPYFQERKSALTCYEPNGSVRWVVTLRGKIEDGVRSVAVDPEDHAIVAGTHVPKSSTDGRPTAYLAKRETERGKRLWLRDVPGTGRTCGLCVDEAGRIYLGDATIDSSSVRPLGPHLPYEEAPLLVGFDAEGNEVFQITGVLDESDKNSWGRITAVASLPGGGCVAVGEARGSVRFDTHELSLTHEGVTAATTDDDVFVIVVSPHGEVSAATRLGSTKTDNAYDVAIVGDRIVVTGVFDQRFFLAELDSSGNVRRVTRLHDTEDPDASALPFEIASTATHDWIAGWFRNEISLGSARLAGSWDQQFLLRIPNP